MRHTGRIVENGFVSSRIYPVCRRQAYTTTTTTLHTSTMSTSNIPIYYDNHLVGSITLAEFMSQPRYDGHSVATLMSLTKEELRVLLVSLAPAELRKLNMHPTYQDQDYSKSWFLGMLMMLYWDSQGRVRWERDAISEILRVYL